MLSGNPAGIRFPAIPHAVHRANKRLVGVQRLQLAAQVFDVAVDGAVGHHAVIVIQMVEQLLAGKHFSRLVGEGFQQAELRGGEIQ